MVHFDDFEQFNIVLGYLYKHALRWAYEPNDNPKAFLVTFICHNCRGSFYMPCLSGFVSKEGLILSQNFYDYKDLWPTYDDTPQSHVITRMTLHGAVMIHQLNHFLTSNYDLDSYAALVSLHNLLEKLHSCQTQHWYDISTYVYMYVFILATYDVFCLRRTGPDRQTGDQTKAKKSVRNSWRKGVIERCKDEKWKNMREK
jgi:hypothetical protein